MEGPVLLCGLGRVGFLAFYLMGGALAVDYGFLLNPSRFLIPQNLNTLNPATTVFQIQKGQLQFRFSQTF